MSASGGALLDSEYRREALGNGRIRFLVTPASVPTAAAHARLIGAVIGVLVGAIVLDRYGLWLALPVGVGTFSTGWIAGRWALGLAGQWLDRRRSPGGSFVASPAGIELPTGGTIPQRQLYRLVLKNGLDSDAAPGDVTRPGAAGVAYMLCAEHAGLSITLAGGMSRATAHHLLQDTLSVLRYSVPALPAS
jgi:hypothetical protein